MQFGTPPQPGLLPPGVVPPNGGQLDIDARIKEAMASLTAHRDRMMEVRTELEAASTSVTSKDRMVSVTVGPQGQVVSLTFHTTAYQQMAPAELATALIRVLNDARARMGEQVTEKIKGFADFGSTLRVAAGFADMPSDLDELMKPLRSMGAEFEVEEAKEKEKDERQEEYIADEATAAAAKAERGEKQEEFAAESDSRVPTGKQEEFHG
ncbi:YbaB/EbfC family nucleoid-associated protein [Streptomyces sp. NPDC090025]|uniref:YbaB/EbfC family nucleoid-associated protein n=1 Tax=Streptomyces sp. NPDC090025 TaxID=3365922 RepID=UPI0038350990